MTAQTPGQQSADDVTASIDAAVDGLCACGCKQPLPPDGHSAYFLGEGHQRAWSMRNAANLTVSPAALDLDWTLSAEYTRIFQDYAERLLDEASAMVGAPPTWPPLSPDEVRASFVRLHSLEHPWAASSQPWRAEPLGDPWGIPVVTSPLVPEGQMIVASDGTRDGLRTPVVMVKDLSSLTPKPAPRRRWWHRLLWWRRS